MNMPTVSRPYRGECSNARHLMLVRGIIVFPFCFCRFKNLQKHKSHFVRTAEDQRKAALWQATVARLTNADSDMEMDGDTTDEK